MKKKELAVLAPDLDLKSFEVTAEQAFITVSFGNNEYRLDVGSLTPREMMNLNDTMVDRLYGSDEEFGLRLVLQKVVYS